ncbi:hypothetical protein B0H14DRAFT_3145292 [Mycena olivaceomarginata]|nr:hypothetical protein B0H14DRAFT_3145292 [Mycena olivaceomarginata]
MSRSASPSGEPLVDLGSPRSRPVTPELLYSRVVVASSGVPVEDPGAARNSMQSIGDASDEQSPAPRLTADVDYGLLDGNDGCEDDTWTKVDRKTAQNHCESSASRGSATTDTTPVLQATHSLTPAQLRNMARRYEQMANEAERRMTPSGELHPSGYSSVKLIRLPQKGRRARKHRRSRRLRGHP